MAHVGIVNVNNQVLIRILRDVLHPRFSVFGPAHLAVALEGECKVYGRLGELHHAGVQSRQEKNVVDQFQQEGCVTLDFLYEVVFVGRVMFLGKEFGKAYHRRDRCAYFVAHVVQEYIFDVLHFLGLRLLVLQFLFRGFLFADVTA